MCGISGTIFKSNFNQGIEIKIPEMEECLKQIEKGKATVDELLNIAWKYKSNTNFIRFFNSNTERKSLKLFSDKVMSYSNLVLNNIKNIDKNKSPQLFVQKYSDFEKLLDINWFLTKEPTKLFDGINSISQKNKLTNSSIVFYKTLYTILSSMDNRLEVRGRDSLGLCIQIELKSNVSLKNYESTLSNDFSEYVIFESISKSVVSFVFKTANRVGSLGDNCSVIIDKIKSCNLLHKFVDEESIKSATIVSHTRWASVGEVSISNCHPISNLNTNLDIEKPLIHSSLNGDIHNYRELIDLSKYNLKNLDPKCTTDCLSIPLHLSKIDLSSVEQQIEAYNKFQGSYAIAIQNSLNTERILLSSKGSQGLYIGVSYDSIMFASDVYGLVENCRYFKSVESGSLLSIDLSLNPFGEDFQIELHNLKDGNSFNIKESELQTTNITTRDIDRSTYNHFLLKEINETSDIVQRTILGYLQSEELTNPINLDDAIICDENQVPEKIIEKMVNNEIRNIVITGMGTCYTAAVAISGYMRTLLSNFLPNINVQPHIASEGSGFYLSPDMNDTLVIVIAQSGTTVDTNVYVQMAKDRGASSIAIANKREGDVTFIVDGTLYIGSGRDIEIAVPSTKTYTAQVILGYILSLYFACRLNSKGQKNDTIKANINSLRSVPNIIKNTFDLLENLGSEKFLSEYPLKHKSWYLAFDNSPNSVCAMEIRIKYSEGCYHSLPYIHIQDLKNLEVSRSFITYVTNEPISKVKNDIILLSKKNKVLVINSDIENKSDINDINSKNISFVFIPNVDSNYSFIPTTLAGQLISYFIAVELDKRKDYFKDLIDIIELEKDSVPSWQRLVSLIEGGYMNQGFSTHQIEGLKSCYEKFTKSKSTKYELLEELHSLYDFARRPIDTIKHQAKTLTVGAVRQVNSRFGNFESFKAKNRNGTNKNLEEVFNFIDSIKFTEKNPYSSTTLVYPQDIDESYGYYIVNKLNNLSNQLSIGKSFQLAHHYDLDRITNDKRHWIVIKNTKSDGNELFSKLKSLKYYNIDAVNINNITKYDQCNFSLGISFQLCKMSLSMIDDEKKFTEIKESLKSQYFNLFQSFSFIENSEIIKNEVLRSINYINRKNNYKILGSGVNYNSAKFASKQMTNLFDNAWAFDVLENHKHIDISAEAVCMVLIHNIWRQGYQNDVLPEIEKLVSHDNIPIIVTNQGDDRFDQMEMKVNWKNNDYEILNVPVIKFPKIDEEFAFLLNSFFFNYFSEQYRK